MDDYAHNAFTSICQWRDRWWLAHRVARTHGIVPPGHIQLWLKTPDRVWDAWGRFEYPHGDLRDPKLIPTDEALYLMAGVYLPHPAREAGAEGLSKQSHENLLHTVLCYTTDGATWSPWVPILRPQYWGWSVLRVAETWACVAYHCGQPGEPQSLVLWTGKSLLKLAPLGTIYEGMSQEREGRTRPAPYRYPSLLPSEAMLYPPTPRTIGCLVRTGTQMEVGVSSATSHFQDWRWSPIALEPESHHHTTSAAVLHPSGLLQTPQGWLLAARHCAPVFLTPGTVERHTYSTRLYHLQGRVAEEVLRLPSQGDCAYAEVCQGPAPETVLVSFYSQGTAPALLPRTSVAVATVHIED